MSNRGLSSYKYILVYKFANLWRAYKYVDKLGTVNKNTDYVFQACEIVDFHL